jgi:hypothetical protein
MLGGAEGAVCVSDRGASTTPLLAGAVLSAAIWLIGLSFSFDSSLAGGVTIAVLSPFLGLLLARHRMPLQAIEAENALSIWLIVCVEAACVLLGVSMLRFWREVSDPPHRDFLMVVGAFLAVTGASSFGEFLRRLKKAQSPKP